MKPIPKSTNIVSILRKEVAEALPSALLEIMYEREYLLKEQNKLLSEDCGKYGSFCFISRDAGETVTDFIMLRKWLESDQQIVKSKNKHTFLDAGAGIGNILLLANRAKLSKGCIGLEFNKPTIKAGKEFLNTVLNGSEKKNRLIYGNILNYKYYGRFDIIYYFCPFCNRILELYFEECLEDQADLGTILIPKFKNSTSTQTDYRFTHIILSNPAGVDSDYDHQFRFYVKTENGPRSNSDLSKHVKNHKLLTARSKNWSLEGPIQSKYKTKIIRFANRYE